MKAGRLAATTTDHTGMATGLASPNVNTCPLRQNLKTKKTSKVRQRIGAKLLRSCAALSLAHPKSLKTPLLRRGLRLKFHVPPYQQRQYRKCSRP